MQPVFCYERDFANRWLPVIYFDKPGKSVNGSDKERSQMWVVPWSDLLGSDGVSPDFKKLMEKYPIN